jgi:hypothetical protein
VEENFRQREGIFHVAVTNEPPGGDDGYATIPDARRASQFIQHGFIPRQKPRSGNIGRAAVNSVPVMDETAAAHVEGEDSLPESFISFSELQAENLVGQRTLLMGCRLHEFADVFQRQRGKFSGDSAYGGSWNTKEDIAGGVFEEAPLRPRPNWIGELLKGLPGGFKADHVAISNNQRSSGNSRTLHR